VSFGDAVFFDGPLAGAKTFRLIRGHIFLARKNAIATQVIRSPAPGILLTASAIGSYAIPFDRRTNLFTSGKGILPPHRLKN
jgi:hypothetical protein